MKHRIRSAAIIKRENKILLVKHVHPKTGYTFWVPPGGGVENRDKDIFDSVKREVWEETGLEVDLKRKVKYIREFYDKEMTTLNLELFVEGTVTGGNLTIENIHGNGRDEHFIKSANWVSREKIASLEVFPEIIKSNKFWSNKEDLQYLGRQNG